jgi:spermidine synthase
MGKISDFLAGIKVLEEADSKQNGKITVVKSLAFGTYFQVGGLTQSGGIIKEIWRKPLRKISNLNIENCLVLGLGGGSIISVIKKYWPIARITAVDIDPTIVKLGQKYLNLDSNEIDIKIGDAYSYLTANVPPRKTKYDLICVDLYVGDTYPEKFENIKFVRSIKEHLTFNGVAIINRLYYGQKRPVTVIFGNMLEKVFSKVDWIYPEANLMFVCSK